MIVFFFLLPDLSMSNSVPILFLDLLNKRIYKIIKGLETVRLGIAS